MVKTESKQIEEFKAKRALKKLDGKPIYDKPMIKTGDKAGCYGSALILLGFGLGGIHLLLGLFTDWDLKLLALIWETTAGLGLILCLLGSFRIGKLTLNSLPIVADKEKNFEIESAYNLYNIRHKPSKKVLLQYDSEEDSLIAVNAGGELLAELLKRIEEDKLPFNRIAKNLKMEEVTDSFWRISYRYKGQEVYLEKKNGQ